MDDETEPRIYKTQIKGVTYSFTPFSEDDLSLVAELSLIGASGVTHIRQAMKLMEAASEPEQWQALTDRLVNREVRLDDLANAFKKLFERQLNEQREKTGAE